VNTIRASRPSDLPALIDVWSRSVRATHDFLSEQDYREIERSVADEYLPMTGVWVAADEQGRPIGFMGLSGAHIDSLFIDPDHRGTGVGKRLVAHAERISGPLTVDVNEQNQQAVGFYRRLGFVQTGRSPVDLQGRAYPLLHLSRPRTP
jgi:putative acetyltransferase